MTTAPQLTTALSRELVDRLLAHAVAGGAGTVPIHAPAPG